MALVSTLLLQTKQDGMVLCVAVALTSALMATRRGQMFWRIVGLETIVIVINLGGWALLLLWLYGPDMAARGRHIVGFNIRAAVTFPHQIARHALDVDSWGILWPSLIALAIWRRDARWPAFIVIALGGYGLAHMLGPPYMLAALGEGHVMNRLLLQILVASIPFTLGATSRIGDSFAAESQPVRMPASPAPTEVLSAGRRPVGGRSRQVRTCNMRNLIENKRQQLRQLCHIGWRQPVPVCRNQSKHCYAHVCSCWHIRGHGEASSSTQSVMVGAQTPLPAALPLFATGLGGLGLLGWRRKRKAQAT
jgi:hypothetical protein